MVILRVDIDNFFSFCNFQLDLSYPKKIVNSGLEENLEGFPNFRFKKVNIIMGGNATGKTTFGRVLEEIVAFLKEGEYSRLTRSVGDPLKEASFRIDIVSESNHLQKICCHIAPAKPQGYTRNSISLRVSSEEIRVNDSYESCLRRLEKKQHVFSDNYNEELDKIDGVSFLSIHPDDAQNGIQIPANSKVFPAVLETVLKTFDPSVGSVVKMNKKGVKDAYAISWTGGTLFIQQGVNLSGSVLSSGTREGIGIARLLASVIEREHSVYYCDEKFSFVHTEMEKAILSLMIEAIGPNRQLFFTTHNTDILDMALPKHSYIFFKKDVRDNHQPIKNLSADSFLKRNTDSLKRAVENDLFGVAPETEPLFRLEEYIE